MVVGAGGKEGRKGMGMRDGREKGERVKERKRVGGEEKGGDRRRGNMEKGEKVGTRKRVRDGQREGK